MNALESCRLLGDAVRDLAMARAHIADVEADRNQYRELLRECLGALADVTDERDFLRRRVADQRSEIRGFTAGVVRQDMLRAVTRDRVSA